MTDNVVKFPKGRKTVRDLLEQVLSNEDDIESIVIVIQKKDDKVMPTWSHQSTIQLAFSSKVLDWEVNQQLTNNHE